MKVWGNKRIYNYFLFYFQVLAIFVSLLFVHCCASVGTKEEFEQDDYVSEPVNQYNYDYRVYEDKEYLDFGAVKKKDKFVKKV